MSDELRVLTTSTIALFACPGDPEQTLMENADGTRSSNHTGFFVRFPAWAQQSPGPNQSYQAEPSSQPTSEQSSSMLSGSEIFSRARASVVVIFAASQDGKRQVLGSGFVVGRDRIATNHHVLAGMDKANVVFSDGDIRSVSGVVADSTQQDLLIRRLRLVIVLRSH